MNELFTALFLGFVEGLTEFIPVSSTAHLVLFVEGLKFPAPPGHIFEVFIQLGAIMAVVVLYRVRIWRTLVDFPRDAGARRFAYNVALATLPALVVGALGRSWIKANLYEPSVIAAALMVGGILILIIEKTLKPAKVESIDDISPRLSFLIGCCQMMALIPGVSRSGATIMGSLLLGLSRPAAAEFSFFLAIPVMFAAVAYDLMKSWDSVLAYPHPELMAAGFLSAFVTAMLVIRLALSVISRFGFVPFAWYRIAAGIIILLIFT